MLLRCYLQCQILVRVPHSERAGGEKRIQDNDTACDEHALYTGASFPRDVLNSGTTEFL